MGLDVMADEEGPSPGIGDWPPDTHDRLVGKVEGVVLEPGDFVQIVIGISRISDEPGRLGDVQVDYLMGGKFYRMVLNDEFVTDADSPMPGE